MGVKSTTRLTREAAEKRYAEAYAERKARKGRAKAAMLTNKDLEDTLERWNDERFQRDYGSYGGFDNFIIVSRPEDADEV